MEEKLSGIVLGGVNYGESDRIITVFTLEKGVISAKVKGVKKAGAKLKFVAEPFCFAEFVFFTRADKKTVKTASLIDSFYPLREDIARYFAGGTAVEFVRKTLREDMPVPELFTLLIETLKDLAYGDKNPLRILAKYLISAFELAGYALNLSCCPICFNNSPERTFFDYNTGSFFCEKCKEEGGREIKVSTFYALQNIENGGEVSCENLINALKLLNYYAINKTEINLKSLNELIKISELSV